LIKLKDYKRIKGGIDQKLRLLERKEEDHKKSFMILLLYPAHPPEEKKRILNLRKRLRNERNWPNTHLMEEFFTQFPYDDTFRLLLTDKHSEPDMIAAVFTEKGSKDGESWELGFLWSFAKEHARATGEKDFYEKFMVRTVAFVEKEVNEKGLCTKMLASGTFKKIIVHSFENDDELLDLVDSTAKRLLDYKFDLLDLF